MADFGSLGRRMAARSQKLSSNVNRAMRLVALAVDREVVTATPVDTGRARSNWIVSINNPVNSSIPPYVSYPKGSQGGGSGTSEGANTQAALNQAAAAVAGLPDGATVYVQNNVDYIVKLNNGHSKQAPKNFVAKSVLVGVATLRRVAKNIFS